MKTDNQSRITHISVSEITHTDHEKPSFEPTQDKTAYAEIGKEHTFLATKNTCTAHNNLTAAEIAPIQKKEVTIIVARSKNKVIGYKGEIPWNCPEDRAHFKELTVGSICVVGYKTWLTLPNRQLKNRTLYVLSSKYQDSESPTVFVRSVNEFFKTLSEHYKKDSSLSQKKICCIGGLQVYRAFLPYTNDIYLTEIHGNYQGDTFFPDTLLVGFTAHILRKTKTATYYRYTRNTLGVKP
ncbi:MAG: dihydrofolate reductase [Spirochaetaceae bacterium]|nr:dihydrofolate reductase [Spirochaetaceae bacterium]